MHGIVLLNIFLAYVMISLSQLPVYDNPRCRLPLCRLDSAPSLRTGILNVSGGSDADVDVDKLTKSYCFLCLKRISFVHTDVPAGSRNVELVIRHLVTVVQVVLGTDGKIHGTPRVLTIFSEDIDISILRRFDPTENIILLVVTRHSRFDGTICTHPSQKIPRRHFHRRRAYQKQSDGDEGQ